MSYFRLDVTSLDGRMRHRRTRGLLEKYKHALRGWPFGTACV